MFRWALVPKVQFEKKIWSSGIKCNFGKFGWKLVPIKKIWSSKLKAVEFKIGQVIFYSGWTKNVTIQTNFIPDEQKMLPSELKA